MDNGGEDDQASGWMQVKKKHRSNLKSSLNGWVGGISSKQTSRYPKNRISSVQETRTEINKSLSANTSKYSPPVPNFTTSVNTTSISLENAPLVHCLDKCIVSQGEKKDLDVENSPKSKPQPVLNPEGKQNDGILPKIQWGDLDEGTLQHYGKPCVSGFNSGVGNCNLVSMISGSDEEPFQHIPVDPEGNKCEEPIDKNNVDPNPNSPSLSTSVTCVEESSREVHEASSEDVKEQINTEKIVMETPAVSGIGAERAQLSLDNKDTLESSRDIHVHRINEEVATENADKSLSTPVSSDICVVPLSNEYSDTQVSHNTKPNISEPILPSSVSVEESLNQQHKPKAENIMDDAVDTSSDATGESKERFRERLWCFLFENLNRAVDELYLLCELECDLDQMKEAGLVLDEAASDFRELSSRVENFEELKRSSPHGADGTSTSLLMQSDHRRPHALSWEVRRMTTSPRRAEILSSSLEAFRKIQEERNRERTMSAESREYEGYNCIVKSDLENFPRKGALVDDSKDMKAKTKKLIGVSDISQGSTKGKKTIDLSKSGSVASKSSQKEGFATSVDVKDNRELSGSASAAEKQIHEKNKMLPKRTVDKNVKSADSPRRQGSFPERDREKRNSYPTNSMDAWKERRNWEDILSSPHCVPSRFSYSPGMSRRSSDRVRVLHDKLMSPEKKKKSGLDLKKEAEEKHARATRIRAQLESERAQKLQRTSEKFNRVNEWQIVRSNKLRESMFARHQRSESRHEAYIAQVVRRAGDESSKVNEVRFITSLNEESKKHILRKKLQDSEMRRAEKLQVIRTKQREDMAREEAVLERKRLLEAEKLQRLAEIQKRKEEAQMRREEERKASSAAREARAMEQMRRKEIRAKAQQEEAELLAQKLAEKLRESEQRRKFYLEQIREKASMDFRDQSSPLLRRIAIKEGPGSGRSASNTEDSTGNDSCSVVASDTLPSEALQQSLKRRIKKIRQRLMSLKHDFPEPLVGQENSTLGYRTALGTARAKIIRWLQDLQKLRQARKDGAANFGLITSEMIKFLEGKDAELQASRQAGLLDFIASALPASHTSKPEACQVTIYLLRLLKVLLVMPTNRCYFLVQNLLPPIIPMLAAALENYIKMAASASIPNSTNSLTSKASTGNLELISEIVDGFLWCIAAIIGHVSCNVYQLQMLDGLVELVITYQIIHRLRDLFALYDRPQVEGSPFPSTILLGIDLLTVLTSKFRESSSIDWEQFSSDVMQENAFTMENFPENQHLKSDPCESGLDAKTLCLKTGSLITHLPDVPEDRPLDVSGNGKTAGSNLMCNDSREAELIDTKSQRLDGVSTEGQPDVSVKQKDRNKSVSSEGQNKKDAIYAKQSAKFLLSAMSETGLVCLPSMLTAVLLQANNRQSTEQSSYVLPSNFEEVATGILKVLNNLALINVTFIQKILSRPDLKMEFFHLMSFILGHCTSNWGTASDKIGSLLLESLSLLGYFALFHPENQAVLRWGNSPTILHKVCDLPFVFFSDPELMPVLAGTLVAASYGSEQNKAVIQQELSIEMLLPLLRSCKNVTPVDDGTGESNQNQIGLERKSLGDASQRSYRNYLKSMRVVSNRSFSTSNNKGKGKNSRDGKVVKLNEEMQLGTSQSTTLILRFPVRFIEKAEEFFAREANISSDELA